VWHGQIASVESIQGGIKMTQKRVVDAPLRRAEILVATLFLVTALRDHRPGFNSERAKLSGRNISQQDRRRLGSPALVNQQYWHRVHRGAHVSLAEKAR
jgi:hypothetical protein